MIRKLAIGYTFLFLFVFTFALSLALASSAQANNCCIYSTCKYPPTLVEARGHWVIGVGCVYTDTPPCDIWYGCF